MRTRIFLFIALIAMVSCQSKDSVERQIDDLLSQMTLEENIATLARLAKQADVVLYFGGEESILSGETRTVTFEISEKDLAYWHLAEGVSLGSEGEYTFSAEKGDFYVWIAPNAAEGEYAQFTLVE